jgi:hypothetical protein
MRKPFIILALAVATVLSLSVSASAVAPTMSIFHDEGSGLPVEDCGTFEVLLTFSHDETITTFYEKAGLPTREQIRFNFSATLSNSVTGKTAHENGAFTIITDLTSGDTKVVGLVLLMYLRGVGVVTLELGQVTFDGARVSVTSSPRILDGASFVCSILS